MVLNRPGSGLQPPQFTNGVVIPCSGQMPSGSILLSEKYNAPYNSDSIYWYPSDGVRTHINTFAQ